MNKWWVLQSIKPEFSGGFFGWCAIISSLLLLACTEDSTKSLVADFVANEVPAIEGLPAGGPAVLYMPPPDIPQLQNRDPRFVAPFEMVSGTERYSDGEYVYTDYLYDDDASTYPDDWARYAGNAADLMEFRISIRGGDLAMRFTYNTLVVSDSTITVVAFDTDQNVSTGGDTLPKDPGLPFPGTDLVLTTWGAGATWSSWNGTSWDSIAVDVQTDTDSNQVTVIVPDTLGTPAGQWLATLATGVFDVDTGSWLPVESTHGSNIVNLGFRFTETPCCGNGDTRVTPYAQQEAALVAGQPTRFAHVLDFDLLNNRGARDNVPTHGTIVRMFASRLPSLLMELERESPGTGYDRVEVSEGKNRLSVGAQFLSRLQPYLVYIPSGYNPAEATPLTLVLHPATEDYFWVGRTDAEQLWGEKRGNIIVAPAARSNVGWYQRESEFDVFEAWNDAARHYNLDAQRVYITGYSMGAYGTYRLGLLYPHLFARAATISGPPAEGIWVPGVTNTPSRSSITEDVNGGDETVSNRWLGNARNLPYFNIADTASELVPFSSQAQQNIGPAYGDIQSFESLGYRYIFWALTAEHFYIGTNFPSIGDFLGDHRVDPEPFHVTYTRMPSNDFPEIGLVHNRAYWLSDIELRDESAVLARGVIDAVSLGFGKSDSASTLNASAGVDAENRPYLETQRDWEAPRPVLVENRILVNAVNIRSITIDPVLARVDCNVQLDVISDGPINIRLIGCNEQG